LGKKTLMNRKLKIVWLCHFSNQAVRSRLDLRPRKDNQPYVDFAPWISNLLGEFEKLPDLELHIISPHAGLKGLSRSFTQNGVHYNFYRPEESFLLSRIQMRLAGRTHPWYIFTRFHIRQIIRRIAPDIVNLFGTENPHYSVAALDIRRIPVYVAAQTVYTNPERNRISGHCDSYRWNLELKLHRHCLYYGCGSRMHRDLIIANNPQAIILKMFFPITKPSLLPNIEKDCDFVFFAAGVSKKKGIEDALEALAIVKQSHPQVSLNVVGSCSNDYHNYLLRRVNELNIKENLKFNGYFPLHSDMLAQVQKSRFALLPVKLDAIPSTIIEAIHLRLPVVTYKTTGTPYLNRKGDAILIAPMNNVAELANCMLRLLEEPSLGSNLAARALDLVENEFDNFRIAESFVANYQAVIGHFTSGTPVKAELLFNPEEFPEYKESV